MKEENFTLVLEELDSSILITVPHGGMNSKYGSWLECFFNKRVKSDIEEKNYIDGEKIVIGGDGQVLHIVSDILKQKKVNLVAGLLPRNFVDYNRFVPEVAYADENIAQYYKAYHQAIEETIEKLLTKHKVVTLFDFHGFGKQPIENETFDIILGTNGESSPRHVDIFLFNSLEEKYNIFCAGLRNSTEFYVGDSTNLYYHKKYGIEGLLVEISPKFRSSKLKDSKEKGRQLSHDLASFFIEVEKRNKELSSEEFQLDEISKRLKNEISKKLKTVP